MELCTVISVQHSIDLEDVTVAIGTLELVSGTIEAEHELLPKPRTTMVYGWV